MSNDKHTRRTFLGNTVATVAGIGLASTGLANSIPENSSKGRKRGSASNSSTPVSGRAALVPLDYGTRYEHSVVFLAKER